MCVCVSPLVCNVCACRVAIRRACPPDFISYDAIRYKLKPVAVRAAKEAIERKRQESPEEEDPDAPQEEIPERPSPRAASKSASQVKRESMVIPATALEPSNTDLGGLQVGQLTAKILPRLTMIGW